MMNSSALVISASPGEQGAAGSSGAGAFGSAYDLLLPLQREGLAEAFLDGAQRFHELELLAFGTLAIDQLPTVRRGLGHPVGVGAAGAALRSASVMTRIVRFALTCVMPRRADSASRSAMNFC